MANDGESARIRGRSLVLAIKFYGRQAVLAVPRLFGLLHASDGAAAWAFPLLVRFLGVALLSFKYNERWLRWWEWPAPAIGAALTALYLTAFLAGVWEEIRGRDQRLSQAREKLEAYERDPAAVAIRYLQEIEFTTDRSAGTGLDLLHALAPYLVSGITGEDLAQVLNADDVMPGDELSWFEGHQILANMALYGITAGTQKDGKDAFVLGPLAQEVLARTRDVPSGLFDTSGLDRGGPPTLLFL